jgi:hypothetical protein
MAVKKIHSISIRIKPEMNRMKTRRVQQFVNSYFALSALEASAAIFWLASIPKEDTDSFILGFSFSRFLMIVFLFFSLSAALLGLLWNLSSKKVQQYFYNLHKRNVVHGILIRFCVFLFFLFSSILLYTGFLNPADYRLYYQRLLPLSLFIIVLSIQLILLLQRIESEKDEKFDSSAVIRNMENPFEKSVIEKTQTQIIPPVFRIAGSHDMLLKRSIKIFLIEVGIFLIIRITGLGITPDPLDWQPNGMTIQYWELIAVFLSGIALLAIARIFKNKIPQRFQTILFFILIWMIASLLWTSISSSEVLKHSYFMEITPPNHVPYPASDAAYFGLWSESLISGLGFKNSVVSRQFYVAMLALFQLISKKNILLTIDLQTIFLALIPAMLFVIGKQLHTIGAGLLTAGIAILREYNTLLLAPHYGVSNSKMFLSDLPTMLFFLFFLSACIAWYQNADSKNKAILAGGLLGLVSLIRSQFFLFFPLIFLLFLFQRKKFHRKTAVSLLFFSITLLAVLTPALIRSISVNGTLFLEDSDIHGSEIARRYSNPAEVIPSQNHLDNQDKSENQEENHIIQFILKEPFYVLHFISNHFLKNQIDSWLVLPAGLSFDLTAEDLLDTSYHQVTQRISNQNIFSLLFFAVFIACGFAASINNHGLIGLLPFFLSSCYMFTVAAGRYSGWRFVLPADWIYYFYFSAGFIEVIQRLFKNFKSNQNSQAVILKKERSALRKSGFRYVKPFVLFLVLIFIGSLPVSLPYLIPDQIVQKSQSENLQTIEKMAAQYGEPFLSILQQVNQENLLIKNGRTIYPRYFEAGQGLTSANPWTVYEVRDFNRLGFILLNQENTNVIIPMDSSPDFVPNSADCLVIGTQSNNGYFEGSWLIFPELIDSEGKPLTFSD